jgi:hypothetical protein
MNESEESPPLVGAPRHLKRRILHHRIPDIQLVRSVDILPQLATDTEGGKRGAYPLFPRLKRLGLKKLVALVVVTLVAAAIPALIAALILTD